MTGDTAFSEYVTNQCAAWGYWILDIDYLRGEMLCQISTDIFRIFCMSLQTNRNKQTYNPPMVNERLQELLEVEMEPYKSTNIFIF